VNVSGEPQLKASKSLGEFELPVLSFSPSFSWGSKLRFSVLNRFNGFPTTINQQSCERSKTVKTVGRNLSHPYPKLKLGENKKRPAA